MVQKVLKVGSSAAVIIPKKSLEQLGLRPGDQVNVEVNRKDRSVLISPVEKASKREKRIAELTYNFIDRYRKDLESLAKK